MKKQKVRVECNCCKQYLNVKIKEKNMNDNFAIKIKYFVCSKCGAKYLVEIENNISRSLKDERRKIQVAGLITDEDNDKYLKLKSQIKENENQLKAQYKELLVQKHF